MLTGFDDIKFYGNGKVVLNFPSPIFTRTTGKHIAEAKFCIKIKLTIFDMRSRRAIVD